MSLLSPNTDSDITRLRYAIQLALRAQEQGEVPVGAVLFANDEIIGEGWNCPISTSDPTAHAEIKALRMGASRLNNYRLLDTTLYVTLEPCIMCAGAIVHSRVKRVVFGAFDSKAGAVSSLFNIFDDKKLNHSVEYVGGLLNEECSSILKNFFEQKRILQKTVI
jgi:tRNA(adenine34) deaminase